MKYYVALTAILMNFMLNCSPAVKSTNKPTTPPKQPKCKLLHKHSGVYSYFTIQRCRLMPGKPRVTSVAIALLGPSKKAAEESLPLIKKYLGKSLGLALFTKTKVNNIPVLIFIVTGID